MNPRTIVCALAAVAVAISWSEQRDTIRRLQSDVRLLTRDDEVTPWSNNVARFDFPAAVR